MKCPLDNRCAAGSATPAPGASGSQAADTSLSGACPAGTFPGGKRPLTRPDAPDATRASCPGPAGPDADAHAPSPASRPLPPKPAARAERVSLWRYLRLFRRDILSAQPARLYRAWMAEFRTPFFRSYLCNDPALVDLVLKRRPRDFPKSGRIREGLTPLLGPASVFLTNGPVWERQRRIIDPAFEGGRLGDTFPAMWAAGEAAVARLGTRIGPDGGEVEIEAEMSHAAADVIFRTLFSIPIAHETAAAVFAAFRAHQRAQPILNLGAFLPLPHWLPRLHRPRTRATARMIRRRIAALTAARAAEIAAGTAPDDLATKIMTTPDPETGETFATAEMVDQVAIFFLAGHETSASALAWSLWLLAAHPDWQDRLAAEAQALLPAQNDAGPVGDTAGAAADKAGTDQKDTDEVSADEVGVDKAVAEKPDGGTGAGGGTATGRAATGGAATSGIAASRTATNGMATGGVATGGVATVEMAAAGSATDPAVDPGLPRRLAVAQAVFREALRLYPPVPMMVRETLREENFRGRSVARASQVVLSPWHLHRHARIWEAPDAFDPGRFATENGRDGLRRAYIPFSAGPRVCPGAGFAMAEGPLLLALLVRAFRFETVAEHMPVPEAHLTVRGRDGIRLCIKRR